MIEIQRAVAAAEARTIEMIAQERIKMEKLYADLHRSSTEPVVVDGEGQTTTTTTGSQNVRQLIIYGNIV